MARVIQVIETDELKGTGKQDDPYRRVMQYWTFEGQLLWENEQQLQTVFDGMVAQRLKDPIIQMAKDAA